VGLEALKSRAKRGEEKGTGKEKGLDHGE